VWVTPPPEKALPTLQLTSHHPQSFGWQSLSGPQTQLKQNQGAEPFLRLVFGGITINLEA